jgi:SAM-dependent methyltransferase
MGIDALFLVADGRFLPFPENIFERVFSYSVLQHLSPQDVHLTLREAARVLRPGGTCTAQMANAYGLRCLQHQRRRGFREATSFEVRYWTPGELLRAFEAAIGPSCLSADGFLSLNAQISDIKHLPAGYKPVVCLSEGLRVLSKVLSPLKYVADSLYIESWKSETPDYARVPVCN